MRDVSNSKSLNYLTIHIDNTDVPWLLLLSFEDGFEVELEDFIPSLSHELDPIAP